MKAMEDARRLYKDPNVKGYTSMAEFKKTMMEDQRYTLKPGRFKENYKLMAKIGYYPTKQVNEHFCLLIIHRKLSEQ